MNGLEKRSNFLIHYFLIWNVKEYSMKLNDMKFKNIERKFNKLSC